MTPNVAYNKFISGPNIQQKIPAIPKTIDIMKSRGPQTVKSVVVVTAYKVIAIHTPAVKHTASIISL